MGVGLVWGFECEDEVSGQGSLFLLECVVLCGWCWRGKAIGGGAGGGRPVCYGYSCVM